MTILETIQPYTNHLETFPILMNLKGIVKGKGLIKISINVEAKIQKDPEKAIYYVFTINESLYFDEIQLKVGTFRLEYNKEKKDTQIYFSTDNGYCVLENVTFLFKDESVVLKECIRQDETRYVSDITEEFIEYWNTPEDERLD